MNARFRHLLGRLKTFKIQEMSRDSEGWTDDDASPVNDGPEVPLLQANVVSSLVRPGGDFWGGYGAGDDGKHIIAIDIDHPAHLVESSTMNHHHLCVEIPPISAEAYFEFLDACVKVGLVGAGYVEASRRRGRTDLRLPWIDKHEPQGPPVPQIKPPVTEEPPL